MKVKNKYGELKSRLCFDCHKEKPIEEFVRKLKNEGKRSFRCTDCTRKQNRKYYREHKKERQKVNTRNNARRIKKLLTHFLEYLSTHPCVDCGSTDVRVLECDHVGKKKKNVGMMMRSWENYVWDEILEELTQCEIVCANCHRIRTYTRCNAYRIVYHNLQILDAKMKSLSDGV